MLFLFGSDHLAAFQEDGTHIVQILDVLKGLALYGDDVRAHAFLQLAELVTLAQCLCAVLGGALQSLHGCQTALDEIFTLQIHGSGLGVVGAVGVGAAGDAHAGVIELLKVIV